MAKSTTFTAGIDTAKDKLDAAIPCVAVTLSVPNDKTGWKKLARIFAKHKVGRIGIEATGGYERGVVRALQTAGLCVVLLQPLQVNLANKRDLVLSIPGIGERTALAVIVRMPELGQVTRQEAAALAGLAPFVHQSGKYAGQTHIGGGRGRLRPRSMRQPCRRPRSGTPHVWHCMNAWLPTAKSRSARWWPAHASC
jgi:transposase